MIKKIDILELRLGMYVHDLDCGWMEHPFLQNHFLLKKASDIEKISALGIRHLYIDTDRGIDAPNAPSAEEVHRHLDAKMRELGENPTPGTRHQVPVEVEMLQARRVFTEATGIVSNVLLDYRLGKQVELEKVEPIVSAITASIFRNPDAILSLLRIKQVDKYTFQHSVAVSTLLLSFRRAISEERKIIEQVGIGGLLHDIGKMRVPDAILNKPGKLSESEFDLMKRHVEYGCEILQKNPNFSPLALSIVAEHHERHDGSGYPKGLKGGEISPFGQMAAIIDVYDALTSNRIYHHAIEPTEALKKILEWSEYHFNTTLVHQFIRTVGIYPVGTLVRLESGYLAVVLEQHHENLLHPRVRLVFNSQANCPMPPKDVDLSKPGCQDRIVAFEQPKPWNIDPLRFLVR